MWSAFILENLHFAVDVFAALVFFSVFYLYIDAWGRNKSLVGAVRTFGFLLLSLSFLVDAVHVESFFVQAVPRVIAVYERVFSLLRLSGYASIIAAEVVDPLQKRPEYTRRAAIFGPLGSSLLLSAFPAGAVSCGFLILRRATEGLEHHLKPLSAGLFLLSISELLGMRVGFVNHMHPDIVSLTSAFGPLWIAQYFFVFASAVVIGRWVFGYLLRQFETQQFMIITTGILAVSVCITVVFSTLLLQSFQREALSQIETDVRVLQYAVTRVGSEVRSDAETLAQNPQIAAAVDGAEAPLVRDLAEQFLRTRENSELIVVGSGGEVIARGEDRARVGDSLSSDPYIARALSGTVASGAWVQEGVVAPVVSMRAAAPIVVGVDVIGAVVTAKVLDDAFVAGIARQTNLQASVFGEDTLSATTLMQNGAGAAIHGWTLDDEEISSSVLIDQEAKSVTQMIFGTPYMGAYAPVLDLDDNAVGMLFIGKEQSSVLLTAARSIVTTYLFTIVLICLSVIPSYWISKTIVKQIS